MVDSERLNYEVLKNLIDDYLFTDRIPLTQEIIDILQFKPRLIERRRIGNRIVVKIQEFVDVYLDGVD